MPLTRVTIPFPIHLHFNGPHGRHPSTTSMFVCNSAMVGPPTPSASILVAIIHPSIRQCSSTSSDGHDCKMIFIVPSTISIHFNSLRLADGGAVDARRFDRDGGRSHDPFPTSKDHSHHLSHQAVNISSRWFEISTDSTVQRQPKYSGVEGNVDQVMSSALQWRERGKIAP